MKIKTDRNEYSRYVPGADLITVSVAEIATLADPLTPLTIELVRNDGFGTVVRRVITPASASLALPIPLDTPLADPALGELAATRDGICYTRQGEYYIIATQGATTVRSKYFYISAVTVDEIMKTHLFGVPMHAVGVLMPVNQPLLPWLRVSYVDPGTLKGLGDLVFDHTADTLSWRGGAPVTLGTDDIQVARLLTPEQDSYIEIEIDQWSKPTEDTTDRLLIDNLRLRPDELRGYCWNAYNWVQQQLHIRLETTIVTTDPSSFEGYYDLVVDQFMYERGNMRMIHLTNSACRPLRQVSKLRGYYANQSLLNIPGQWITIQEKAAIIELIPVQGATSIVAPLMGTWGYGGLAGREIMDFWHVDLISGLPDLNNSRYSIREAIARRAAMQILMDLSLAATTGRTSRQASREGVSESWSYGQGGAYGEKISAYADWLKEWMPKLRQYYVGLEVITL